jgi:two-component system OmpR family sensor kinase
MMKSLLNKNLWQFIGCMLVILILATPLFYLLTRDYYSEEMIEAVKNISSGKAVSPSDMEEDIVEGMVLQFMLIFAVLSLSMLLVMRFLTRRLWKPFDDTLQKVEQFNLDSGDIPHFTHSNIKEFERLNNSVEKLMQKDKGTYNSQKEFTENASHELQTPIAILQSKLDLLTQEHLDSRQASLVTDMYAICKRLSHLNKSLLLLAKIENSQYYQTEKVPLLPFVTKRIQSYSELNTGGGNILLNDSSTDTLVSANTILLESMIDNLVVNAIRHKKAGTDVVITVKAETLSVVNEGAESGALDKDMLYSRFNNHGNRNRGNGLGLSIVKAICDYHHWTIDYHFDDGKHCFVIRFGA